MNFTPQQLNDIIVHQAAQVMASQQLAEHNAQLCNKNRDLVNELSMQLGEVRGLLAEAQAKIEGFVDVCVEIREWVKKPQRPETAHQILELLDSLDLPEPSQDVVVLAEDDERPANPQP